MVMDALRGYVQLANGLTEVTRQKAQAAAKALLQQTGADSLTTRVSDLADEIVATSKSNRQLLQAIVSNEVEGAVARLGFARSEEVAGLTRRVKALETELAEARAAAAAPVAPEPQTGTEEVVEAGVVQEDAPTPAAKVAAHQAAVKKAVPKKAPAKKAATKTANKAVKKAPAKKTAKKA
ncbi:polyhydroxyalkanoate synthesis protein PhaF [Kribbella sp. HUAS MG21]|uniref:Polyhydroxyalkanoate synthesis protein PhaF n=1 Tax=Kribbella sp. HUAS MG21 TaxID=3160966 RepID=A0AAU7T3X3_9ACTN